MLTYIIFDNLTDEFISFRASQRARSPPRKQRIKHAIKQQYYEDVRRLLTIAPVDEQATTCAKCQGPLSLAFWLRIGASTFACQLCNDTCCGNCRRNVLLAPGNNTNSQLNSVMCKECGDYVTKLRSYILDEPPSSLFTHLTGSFKQILDLYQDVNAVLLQLQGYVKLCSIHRQLEEPLPHGTNERIHNLLTDVISQRKHISDIKKDVANYKLENEDGANLLIGVRRSLLVLSTGILYKTIPKINDIVHTLTKLGLIKPM
ncbi:hypothetical protein X943_003000 [Babesia divergens]|uniref:FYVE-type domain-containing protein n=1 Tax=Babesia divergens TaxID=32595 RepID=A0AAD9LI89_BABDI|nr:hypothetical protein X943_003000 [Babesia divergens]